MPIAYWQDEYCTGNQQVDQEHQQLFELVNSLHDAMLQEADHQTLKEILSQLASHTIQHFQTEEDLMKANHYPGYDLHQQIHDGLKIKVANLLQKFAEQKISISVELTEFLTEWLAHHIRGEDQKMIRFFRDKTESGCSMALASPSGNL
jgi:hemerythrin